VKSNTKLPGYLSAASRTWARRILDEYELESHHIRLLIMAAEQLDKASLARDKLEVEGCIFIDRFKQPRQSPWVVIQRNASLAFAKLLKELRLDIEPPNDYQPQRF